jgi:hypothetical protein
MPQLILGIVALYLVLAAIKQFSRITPQTAAKIMRGGGAGVGLAVVGMLLLRGVGGVGGLVLSALLGGALRGGRNPFASWGNTGAARTSAVRSAAIEMKLDRDTGAMSGAVTAGPFAGRALDGMARPECVAVWRYCRIDDPQGAALVEAYLDRRFPGWREAAQGDGDARRGGGGSGAMTRDEAYEILGLPKGSGREEIVAAHRRLMKKLHPDHGGTTALAARVNQAKDVLVD